MGMQDPNKCSTEVAPGHPGAIEEDGNSFNFSANDFGTSTNQGATLQYLCFLNGSDSTWDYITITPLGNISASDVFCDSQPNNLGTAFTCKVNFDPTTDFVTSIVFNAAPGDTGIPANSVLLIDLNPCTVTGENCVNPGQGGNIAWPADFGFSALVPEPTSFALLGTGLLVTFRKRLLKSKS